MKAAGIRFHKTDKIHFFDPGEIELAVGGRVVVDTGKGLELGEVSFVKEMKPEEVGALRKVVRIASPEDEQKAQQLMAKGQEYLLQAQEEARRHGLPMKLVRAHFTLDGRRLILDFSAPERVHFKELVRELSKRWGGRVEFRQVGSRDVAKGIGGLGLCGLPICCSRWLCRFKSISLKMATMQGLAPNPERLTGPCGRLICCLAFELEYYLKARAESDATEGSPPDNDKE